MIFLRRIYNRVKKNDNKAIGMNKFIKINPAENVFVALLPFEKGMPIQ
jgi:hypothetical protein